MASSLYATVPERVTVVVMKAISFSMSAVVVTCQTEQDQPFGAVVKFPMVTVTVNS
jgi:hypothetical protein